MFKSARIQISSQKTRGGQTQKLPKAAFYSVKHIFLFLRNK